MEVAGVEIKGVIFDMDGVLLFSNEIHEKAYNIARAIFIFNHSE